MNHRTKLLLFGIVITFQLLTFNVQLLYALDTRTTAAVVDLQAKEGVSPGVASMLSDYLRTQLVNTNKFVMVTRENMESILKEQQFQMTGCTSNECVIEAGKLLGVRKIFSGSIGKIGGTFIISLGLVDVQSGQIERAETERCEQCEENALLASAENIAYKITSVPKPKKEEKGKGKGIIKVSSTPAGADVYVNGELKGKSPVTAEGSEGSNEIALFRQGYITVVKTVELKAGEEKELAVPLEQQQASLSIQIEPSGVKLTIDGENKGIIEQKNLQYSLVIGKHNISAEKENYLPYQKDITVEYPKTELQITLSPKPGSLLVITTPEGAKISVDGNYKGNSPLIIKELSAETHKVKASYKGFYEEQEVTIPPGGNKTANIIIQEKKLIIPKDKIENKSENENKESKFIITILPYSVQSIIAEKNMSNSLALALGGYPAEISQATDFTIGLAFFPLEGDIGFGSQLNFLTLGNFSVCLIGVDLEWMHLFSRYFGIYASAGWSFGSLTQKYNLYWPFGKCPILETGDASSNISGFYILGGTKINFTSLIALKAEIDYYSWNTDKWYTTDYNKSEVHTDWLQYKSIKGSGIEYKIGFSIGG